MNGLSEYSRQEETAWAQAEFLEEKSPGLFSLSPKWFKFSDYEILNTKSGFYIAPTKGSIKELYEPFKLFPTILEDYLKLLIDNKSFEIEYQKVYHKECSNDEFRQIHLNLDLKRTEMILPFVKKYGLFGLFNDCLIRLKSDIDVMNDKKRQEKGIECDKYIAILNPRSRCYLSSFFQKYYIGNNYSIEYEKLAAYFLPRSTSPLPNVDISRTQAKAFYENYSEPLNSIISYPDITDILRYEKLIKKYESSGSKLDDMVESIHQESGRTDITFKRVLNFSINNLGITLIPENGTWDLSWNFKSLFSALSIMYAMNKAGKMGRKIQLCQYSKCNEAVIGTKYCCPQHADAARQERCRANKKKKEGTINGDNSKAW